MASPYDTDLDRNPANYQPLTPLTYLSRSALIFPDHVHHAQAARNLPTERTGTGD